MLGRDLLMVPKLIHPLPPEAESPYGNGYEGSMFRGANDVWMQDNIEQRPPTPVRGRGGGYQFGWSDFSNE